MKEEGLAIMVKNPALTRVKTRLAEVIGPEVAGDLYRAFVADTLRAAEGAGLEYTVAYTPSGSQESLEAWLGKDVRLMEQEGGDLGERMKNVFLHLFRKGHERIVLTGSDIPDLTGEILKEAFSRLRTEDAVIGPAMDGGYYLIGFTRNGFLPDVFDGIPWGTEWVFDDTAEIFKKKGRPFALLPKWSDVDTVSDLKTLFERHEQSDFRHSLTMARIIAHRAVLFP